MYVIEIVQMTFAINNVSTHPNEVLIERGREGERGKMLDSSKVSL